MEPIYFISQAAFRAWLMEHHQDEKGLILGFFKKGASQQGLGYQEAVDEALCFGWIDGVRRSVDAERYTGRFSPRKPKSSWSTVNVRRVNELVEQGLMHPAGLAAFNKREESRSRAYSYEATRSLDPQYEEAFRGNQRAWSFFEQQPPSYRRAASWWVMSAKREETRMKRLGILVETSAQGKRLDALRPGRREREESSEHP